MGQGWEGRQEPRGPHSEAGEGARHSPVGEVMTRVLPEGPPQSCGAQFRGLGGGFPERLGGALRPRAVPSGGETRGARQGKGHDVPRRGPAPPAGPPRGGQRPLTMWLCCSKPPGATWKTTRPPSSLGLGHLRFPQVPHAPFGPQLPGDLGPGLPLLSWGPSSLTLTFRLRGALPPPSLASQPPCLCPFAGNAFAPTSHSP